jgi:hypothetical protein
MFSFHSLASSDELLEKFESKKVTLLECQSVRVELNREFIDFVEDQGIDLNDAVQAVCASKRCSSEDYAKVHRKAVLVLGKLFWERLFGPVLAQIAEHVKQLLLKPEALDCGHVLLVGGTQSDYFYAALYVCVDLQFVDVVTARL